ncbi:Yip1 family protein [uncultured Methanomethylovorans sp.]|uniref:Yip1 family protein n=1 Tax=uncultured Methanomethylovorans sp. TaxID=183759 RepID=UPI002AA64B36|nr:Yip1 family protein [uncultured Methanomethylovorans sp.]
MLEVLMNPGKFFEKKLKEEIDLKPPYAIISTLSLLTVITAFVMMEELMNSLFNGIPINAQRTIIAMGLITVMITVVIEWGIISGAFYTVSLLFEGKGDFKRVIEFVAYGFIPSILSSAIALVFLIYMSLFVDISTSDPHAIETAILSNPYIILANITSIILSLWSANIWVFAMIHSRNLTVKNALITVGIPMVMYLIYMLYTLYQALRIS